MSPVLRITIKCNIFHIVHRNEPNREPGSPFSSHPDLNAHCSSGLSFAKGMTNVNVNRSDVVSAWQSDRPVALSLNVGLVHYLPVNLPEGLYFFFFFSFSCHYVHVYTDVMSGWAVGLAGSNALYHAKLNWIKVWTQWV